MLKSHGQNIVSAISNAQTPAQQKKGSFSSIAPSKSHVKASHWCNLSVESYRQRSPVSRLVLWYRGELRRAGMRLGINKQSLSAVSKSRHSGLNKTDISPRLPGAHSPKAILLKSDWNLVNIKDNYNMMPYVQSIKKQRGHGSYSFKGMSKSFPSWSHTHTHLEKHCTPDIQKTLCSPKDRMQSEKSKWSSKVFEICYHKSPY